MSVDPVRLKAVFFEAIARTDQDERAAYVAVACAGDAELQARVEALLRANTDPDSLLAAPAPPDQLTAPAPPAPPAVTGHHTPTAEAGTLVAGRYKLLQQLGEGGMGTVWMADQTEPVKRRVAVKLIRTDRSISRTILTRFEAERQAIALMDHPNIAKLLDADTTEAGTPFFVMELVKGVPLTEYCDTHRLSIPHRLKLFGQICGAIQHAHQKGIIHRDLKPTNILIESHDDKPVPKVIDFGLAKATTGLQLTEHTLFTGFGTVLGTPMYMAPEQAQFNAVDIDTRADVYALGVILYELLTGTTPLTRESIKRAAFEEVLMLVREQEAPTPSSRISTSETKPRVAANRQSEPAKLGRLVKGELDWIVLKALSKERDRRYETASSFARDIERFLTHEPVIAGPPSASYRLRKFVRRNRGPVVAAGIVLLTLVVGIAGTTLGLIEAWRQEGIARGEAAAKERALEAEKEQRRIAEANEREAIAAKVRESNERAKAQEAAKKEELAKEQAVKERIKAQSAYSRTADVLDAMTSEFTGDSLTTQNVTSDEQKKFLKEALSYYQDFAGQREGDEQSRKRAASAAFRVGSIQSRLGRNEEAVAAFRQAEGDYQKLASDYPAVAAYRQQTANSARNLGSELMGVGLHTQAEQQYRKALPLLEKLSAEYPAVPEYRKDLANSHNKVGALLRVLGRHAESEAQYRRALNIHNKLVPEFPNEPDYRKILAQTHIRLGELFSDLGKYREQEENFKVALAINEKLAAEFPNVAEYRQETALAHKRLGYMYYDLGNAKEAEKRHTIAVAILEKLAAEYPGSPGFRRDLGTTQFTFGIVLNAHDKRAEAESRFRAAFSIAERLTAEFPAVPKYRELLANAHYGLGYFLLPQLGKRTESVAQYRAGMAIYEKLAAEFPNVPDYQQGLARFHNNLGTIYMGAAQWDLAEAEIHRALAIKEKLVADYPVVLEYRQDLVRSLTNVGTLRTRESKFAEAQQQYQKALTLANELVNTYPNVPENRQIQASCHIDLSVMYAVKAQFTEAKEQYQKALVIAEKLAADFPDVPKYREKLATDHNTLANLLKAMKQYPEAKEQYQKALVVVEKLATDFPGVLKYRLALTADHNTLANWLRELRQYPEAKEQYQKALVVEEKLAADFPSVALYRQQLAQTHNNLALLTPPSDRALAKEHHQKALKLREKLAADFPAQPAFRIDLGGSYCNFGIWVRDGGKPAESLEWFDKAIATLTPIRERFPLDATTRLFLRNSHWNRALAHTRLQKYAEEAKDWEKVVDLSDPDSRAWANFQLGTALFRADAGPQAEVAWDRGLALREQAAKAAGPEAKEPNWLIALYLIDRGLIYLNANQNEKAIEWLGRAARAFAVFGQKWPGPEAISQLRWCHQNRAIALGRLGKHAEAVKDWDKAVELCTKQDQPGVRATRATSCANAGQVAEAVGEVTELTKLQDWSVVQWYDFACVYGIASGTIADKKKEYAERAMELLQKAVQAGYKDAAHIKTDTELTVLRDRDDFQSLVAELEKKFPPKLDLAPPPREKK